MSKLFARIAGFFGNRTFIGVDKAGNRYCTKKEEIDGVFLKKEEEERKAREGSKKAVSSGKVGSPDLKSFTRQFPSASEGDKVEQASGGRTKEIQEEKGKPLPESLEPTVSSASYKPGTWQPPT